jgi:hypothetical protein
MATIAFAPRGTAFVAVFDIPAGATVRGPDGSLYERTETSAFMGKPAPANMPYLFPGDMPALAPGVPAPDLPTPALPGPAGFTPLYPGAPAEIAAMMSKAADQYAAVERAATLAPAATHLPSDAEREIERDTMNMALVGVEANLVDADAASAAAALAAADALLVRLAAARAAAVALRDFAAAAADLGCARVVLAEEAQYARVAETVAGATDVAPLRARLAGLNAQLYAVRTALHAAEDQVVPVAVQLFAAMRKHEKRLGKIEARAQAVRARAAARSADMPVPPPSPVVRLTPRRIPVLASASAADQAELARLVRVVLQWRPLPIDVELCWNEWARYPTAGGAHRCRVTDRKLGQPLADAIARARGLAVHA